MALRGRYAVLPRFRGQVAELKNRLSRARYFRGHGVHSPFVYGLVRRVFMSRGPLGNETALRDALTARGVTVRRALELQNLMVHCGYRTFSVAGPDCSEGGDAELWVLPEGLSAVQTLRSVRKAAEQGTTVAVMAPYAGRDRMRMCRRLVADHRSTSVDNRGYLLLFHHAYLPKQHFKI